MLFNDVHQWVNYQSMLSACVVGKLVTEFLPPKPVRKSLPQKSGWYTRDQNVWQGWPAYYLSKMTMFQRVGMTECHLILMIQINEYVTAPFFLQLSQNMISDCLFTFEFFPRFT